MFSGNGITLPFYRNQNGGGGGDVTIFVQGVAATTVTFKMVFASGGINVDWGDGTIEPFVTNVDLTHIYGAPYTGDIRIFGNLSLITEFYNSAGAVSFNTSRLAYMPILEIFDITSPDSLLSGNYVPAPQTLVHVHNQGDDITVSTDVGTLPPLITYLLLRGDAIDLTYTSPRVWEAVMDRVLLFPSIAGKLSTTEIDNILIDLDDSTTSWGGTASIDLRGNNDARSAASDAAVISLGLKGATVLTN